MELVLYGAKYYPLRLQALMPELIDQTQTSAESFLPDRPVAPNLGNVPKQVKTDQSAVDPTRYGDWEKNGRCIDF